MATSGWQSEQFAYDSPYSSYVKWNTNIRVDSIVHSGTNLRVIGVAAWCTRQRSGSGGSTTFGSPVYLTPQNGVRTQVVAANVRQTIGSDYHANFDVTIPNVAMTATSANFSLRWDANNTGGTNTWTLYFNISAVAPSGLAVSVNEIGKDYAVLTGSIASYGTPVADNSYMELALNANTTYGNQYRYQVSADKATSMTSQRIDNEDMTGQSTLYITPNTKYWPGVWATNRAVNASLLGDPFITLPGDFTNIQIQTERDQITVVYSREQEGNASEVTVSYSTDNGASWTPCSSPFTFTQPGSGIHSLRLRATNATGSTGQTVQYYSEASQLYIGDDQDKARLVKKVYIGDENNRAVECSKVYIGDENNIARKVLG